MDKRAALLGSVVCLGVAISLYWWADDLYSGAQEEGIIKPADAPEECPGLGTEESGKADACAGCPNRTICASGAANDDQPDPALVEVKECLKDVKNVLLVLSGKGGVGKSTVSSHLAQALSRGGKSVGLLDVDICGPSIPTMFNKQAAEVHQSAEGWDPVYVTNELSLMSIGFLLPDPDDAVVWRGPKKNGLIRQFLSSVLWKELDYLIIDTPPGTSDEHLSLVTYFKEIGVEGCILVTTPQEVALADVRKEAKFCEKSGIKVIGVVENMTDSVFDGFGDDAENVKNWCTANEHELLERIPLDVTLRKSCDNGIQNGPTPAQFEQLAAKLNSHQLLNK